MAQTKKKRRSKHRGTAAGTIEARGRTSAKNKGGAGDPRQNRRQEAAERRASRRDKPPTWNNAALRGAAAAGVFFVLAILIFNQPVSASLYLAVFALLFYIPLGYYTDLFIYRRTQKRKAQAAGKGKS